MPSLSIAIELRRAAFDISMTDHQIFDIPIELVLELMSIALKEAASG